MNIMGALEGVRVLELGEAIAGPLTCTLLADHGATVIKVERPLVGDSMRRMGPQKNGVGLWWTVTGRGKRSISVDLKNDDGRAIVYSLATEWADVVVENFRPGVLEKLGLGWDELHAANPSVTLVRISGFGQTGPYSHRRGFGKIAEGFSGATNLTGHRGEPPVQPGFALADTTTATFGVIGTLLALHAREHGAAGQLVDLALYEGMLRLIEWQFPLAAHTDLDVSRNGNSFPFDDAFITDIAQCADGKSVIVSAATDETISRLRNFLRGQGATDLDTSSDIVHSLREWASLISSDEAISLLAAAELVVGPVVSAKELLQDSHIMARQNAVTTEHPVLGSVVMPGVVPKLSSTPGSISRPAPNVGADTMEILSDVLGLDDESIRAFVKSGAFGESYRER
jgi:crotonobetainyl-CoA:carnitine CoA-transferase CaiB-like acyl-CoA transferase